MKWVIKVIDGMNETIGKAVSWLSLIIVFIIVIDVSLRYVFSITSAATFELEWHLFAALFLLSAGWGFQQDRHVRVDVFYQKFGLKTRAWVDLLGGLILLLPFCIVASYESLSFVKNSFIIKETTPDPGGLPARYVIKSVIPVSFFLLGLQAISSILKAFKKIVK